MIDRMWRRSIFAVVTAISIAASAAGWAQVDALVRAINQYPPVNEWAVRARQVAIASAELAPPATQWDVVAVLSAHEAEVLLAAQVAAQRAALAQQGIALSEATFKVDAQAIAVTASVRARLREPAMELEGIVRGTVTPAVVSGNLTLRPIVERIEVRDVNWPDASRLGLALALPALQVAVTALRARINGAIPAVTVPIAFPPLQPIDPAAVSTAEVRITGRRIELPTPGLAAAAILIDPTAIRVLASLRLPGDPERPAHAAAAVADDVNEAQFRDAHRQLTAAFAAAAQGVFGAGYAANATGRVAVTRQLITRAFNAAAAQLDWQIAFAPAGTEYPFNSEIRLGQMPEDTRACTTNQCTRNEDTRNCRACLLRRPWDGGCVQEGNDPICEAQKGAQNGIYATNYAACQADAARLRAQCEAEKGANNALLRPLVESQGRVGRVSGTVRIAPRATVAIRRLEAADGFAAITVDATVAANADINATLSFASSGVIGTLTCPFPLNNRPVHATASFGPEQRRLPARIGSAPSGQLILTTDEVPVNVTVQPPPGEALFGQNPDLNITCAGAAALAWSGASLRTARFGGLPDAVTGEFHQRVPGQSIPVALPTFDVPIPGAPPWRFSATLGERALVLDGAPRP